MLGDVYMYCMLHCKTMIQRLIVFLRQFKTRNVNI